MEFYDKTILAKAEQLTVDIPFAVFVKFFLGWNSQNYCQKIFRISVPLISCFILSIDIADWILNDHALGAYEVQTGQILPLRQSPIISVLSYMTSQITYFTTAAVFFGVIAKSGCIRSTLYQMTLAGHWSYTGNHVNWTVSPRNRWLRFGYLSLASAAAIHLVIFFVQMFLNAVASEEEFWGLEPYFVWHLPSGINDIVQRIIITLLRILPFGFYVLYYYLVTLLTNRIVSFNAKLNLSTLAVHTDVLCFEKTFFMLQLEDEEIAMTVNSMNNGFSVVLAGGIFGTFLQICSSTAYCFISNLFSTIWSYFRHGMFIVSLLILLLMFLLSGARLHEAGKESRRLWTELVITHQDHRRKILANVNDAKLMLFLYKVSQRSESLTLAEFVDLTRGLAATLVFAFIGYLCFLVERSEHFRTDEKLAGVLKSNVTLIHTNNITHT